MKKLQVTFVIFFVLVINTLGADLKNQKSVTIYEIGDSIVDYDTNFKNLFRNWTTDKLNNASDYKLLNFAYLETITDSTILDFYGRLMTSFKMLSLSSKHSEKLSPIGEKIVKYAVEPTQLSFDSLFTVKDQRLRKLYEDRLFVKEIKRIYSDDFSMLEVEAGKVGTVRSPKSLSDNEYKAYLLDCTKAERAISQYYFKQIVNIGDAVYVVHFRYLNKLYTAYVVCDSKTKKVKIDGFFKGVQLLVDAE
jgi:hypothetical protein